MKKNFCIILRGFVYKENYLAGTYGPSCSTRGRRRGPYTNNFLNRIDTYEHIISAFKNYHNVDCFLSTYDTTPKNIIDTIKNKNLFTNIFFSQEKGSYQWTTTLTALNNIEPNKYDFYFIIRNDLKIITNLALDNIVKYEYLPKYIYTLIPEFKRQSVIDILQIVSKERLSDYTKFIKKNSHAHFINLELKNTRSILNHNRSCINTELCKILYTIDGCGCFECIKSPYDKQ